MPKFQDIAAGIIAAVVMLCLTSCKQPDENTTGEEMEPGQEEGATMPGQPRHSLVVIRCIVDKNGQATHSEVYPDPVRVNYGGYLHFIALNTNSATFDLQNVSSQVDSGAVAQSVQVYPRGRPTKVKFLPRNAHPAVIDTVYTITVPGCELPSATSADSVSERRAADPKIIIEE